MATVFLSYASEQAEPARQIELSLKADGHAVFVDRSSLPAGESFDARIRAAIEESDLFVFLISAASISPGRYTLTELRFAEDKWEHPAGHVLPVLVERVARDAIPAYLRAVTILSPRGNLTAEVAAEVARLGASWWRRMLEPRRLVPALIIVVLLVGAAWTVVPSYLERRAQRGRAIALVKQSEVQAASGDFRAADDSLQQAKAIAPEAVEVIELEERRAMARLRGVGLRFFRGSNSDLEALVDKTWPTLSHGVSQAKGERLADLLAHMGWAHYLRERAGIGGGRPAEHYRRALEVDARNVYAHAMWGFELLRQRGASAALVEAGQHFAAAVESRRERDYVRHMQVGALLQTYTNAWIDDVAREGQALRVVNEMRVNGEPRPKGWPPGGLKKTIWSIYYFDVVTRDRLEMLLAGLPAGEHLKTFRWLFPEDDLPESEGAPMPFQYFVVLGRLQERSGERAGALASYRRVLQEAAIKKYDGGRTLEIVKEISAAIKRLSG